MAPEHWLHRDEADLPLSWTVRAGLWRVALSILLPVLWLCALLLFFGFGATGLTWAQDFVVGVVSVLALFGALALVWVVFGFQVYHRWVDA